MSLYKHGQSWYFDFMYRGRRYCGCIGQVSKTVAKEIEAKKRAAVIEDRYALPTKKPSPRLADFVPQYLDAYRTTHRPRSTRRHEVAWHAINPVLGTKRLAEITPFDLERYRRLRKQVGKSPVTINRELGFLRHLFNTAIAWGKATENPVRRVKFFRENNGRTRFLSQAEEARLLATCGPQLRPLVVTALHTGCRKAELLSLTWQDVDLRRRTIRVQAAYAKNGERRVVPMNECLTTTLKAVRLHAAEDDAVFQSRNGTPYRSFRSAFERAVRQAGLVNFTICAIPSRRG